ncbi:hypothetical protein AB691_3111 [Stutzerimonas stutzeri]|nr:hypothetical protein AB691_3111 [Stutzerimonas stutzeri]
MAGEVARLGCGCVRHDPVLVVVANRPTCDGGGRREDYQRTDNR